MWKPRTAAEVLAALPDMSESEVFDAKAAPPGPKKAIDFAVDVAAMANDGGLLLYGVEEDKVANSYHDKPFVLAGESERVTDVVHQVMHDPPRIDIWEIPLPEDPARGFLAVAVPASPQAPHMVRNTFWGRSGTTNVRLTQGEIDRLYA